MSDGISSRPTAPTAFALGEESVALEIDLSVYSTGAVLRAAYKFTDRCYVFLARSAEDPSLLVVTLGTKLRQVESRLLAGEFANELIDQQLRENLAKEAGPIRELIVAQAFAEGNLLDPQRDDGDYQDDPLGIGWRR
jgi:His-Xaa-Ser system protein HxsD